MPNRINVTLYQSNVEKAQVSVTSEDSGLAQNLAGATVEVYIKPTPQTSDTDPSVVKLDNGGLGGVVVGTPSTGIVTVTFPPTLTASTLWWRTDVVISGVRKTACFGSLYITDI